MPYGDFRPLIHELMDRDLSIAAFMNELLVAHENAHPQYDWAPLKAIDFDESESLLQRWLVPAFKREPPRAKRIKAISCGLFPPIRDEETVADMYIPGTKEFEAEPRLGQQEQERKESVRHFRHPDGRVWSIGVTDGWIELRFTDTDGETHDRTRFRKWVVEDMAATAEKLVNEQLL